MLLAPLALGTSYSYAAVLEEIVVTAQKREESLQDTPIAVSAFTANTLQDKGIEDISEIANFAPNLVFDTTSPISGLSSGAAVFIRGIGNTDFSLTTDPGVGTYVDGVYVSRSVGGVLDVLDVERIEVLRGPQGTLFGRNTIGGAVSIITRKPAETFQGSVDVTLGNDNRRDVRVSLDVPISESLRTNFSVSHRERDGYISRPLVGDELGDENRTAFRGTAVFDLNNRWDFQLSYDYTNIDEASSGATGLGFTTAFPNGTPGGASVLGYSLATFGGAVPIPVNDAFAAVGAGLADLNQYVSRVGDDVSFGTGTSGTDLEIHGFAFIANYHGDSFDVKYTAALRDTSGSFFADQDNTPVAITEVHNPEYDHEQISHELQITGTAVGDRLTYAAGIYDFDEEGEDNVFVSLFLPITTGNPADFPIGGLPAGLKNFATVDNTSEAAYLQTSWAINDIFSVTAGARWTEDSKTFGYTQYLAGDIGPNDGADGPGTPLVGIFPGAVTQDGFVDGYAPLVGTGTGVVSNTFEDTSFKFGVDAKLDDGTLLYYSFSQGFKSGGFVLRYVAAVSAPLEFDPETLDTHEIGVKWQGFNDRVRLNAAVFSSDYEEIQVTFFDALGGPITANAGTADIKGFEFELTALLTNSLTLDMAYGYTDAQYTSINPIAGLSSAIDESSKLVNTPENTFSAGMEYSRLVGANELALRVDYFYTDDIYNDSQNSPFLFQEAVDTWNATARYSIGEDVDIVAFVKNVTDERFITTGNSNFGLGFHTGIVNRPREIGASIRYRF